MRALWRIISIARDIQRQSLWLSVPWREEIKKQGDVSNLRGM